MKAGPWVLVDWVHVCCPEVNNVAQSSRKSATHKQRMSGYINGHEQPGRGLALSVDIGRLFGGCGTHLSAYRFQGF